MRRGWLWLYLSFVSDAAASVGVHSFVNLWVCVAWIVPDRGVRVCDGIGGPCIWDVVTVSFPYSHSPQVCVWLCVRGFFVSAPPFQFPTCLSALRERECTRDLYTMTIGEGLRLSWCVGVLMTSVMVRGGGWGGGAACGVPEWNL